MSETSIEALAKGLSAGQKRAVQLLPDEFTLWPVSIARVTIKRMKERGLLTTEAPSGFGLVNHKFTELGKALRTHLQESQP